MTKNRFKINIPIAILITLLAVIYQRSTGPTYPKKVYFHANGKEVKLSLLRSHETQKDAVISIPLLNPSMQATLSLKRYPAPPEEKWTEVDFVPSESQQLSASLPHQPPAGKLQYYIKIQIPEEQSAEQFLASESEPVIIRFKGAVPPWILAPHILCMFFAMLLSTLAGLEALSKTQSYFGISVIAVVFLSIGGLILGPIVQKYAFGEFWTGFPYGFDLTDNKTLIAAIFWYSAILLNLKRKAAWACAGAALILLGVYSIPHSALGSQYNYETESVETGK